MGSIIDYMECPDCGSEAHYELWYKSGEEHTYCKECGYTRDFKIKNYEDREQFIKEGFQWIPDFELTEHRGRGAYRLKPKGTIGYECGAFTGDDSESEFIKLVEERKDEIEHAEYSVFVDGRIKKIVLIEGELE